MVPMKISKNWSSKIDHATNPYNFFHSYIIEEQCKYKEKRAEEAVTVTEDVHPHLLQGSQASLTPTRLANSTGHTNWTLQILL